MCRTCSSLQIPALLEYIWPNFEKQDSRHRSLAYSEAVFINIMLNLFIIDMVIDTCVFYKNSDFYKFQPRFSQKCKIYLIGNHKR